MCWFNNILKNKGPNNNQGGSVGIPRSKIIENI